MVDGLAAHIVDTGLKVHRALGPGLLESAYEHCLAHELKLRGISIESQMLVPIIYDDARLDAGYRADLFVDNKIIIEVKAPESLAPIHHAQLLTYLRLSGCRIGFLMNFGDYPGLDGHGKSA